MTHITFSLYLVAILLGPHRWLEGARIPFEQIMAIVALLSLLLFRNKDDERNPAFSTHAMFLALMFLWMVISLFVNDVSNTQLRNPGLYDASYKMFIAYLLAALSIKGVKELTTVLSVFVLICLLTAINGILVHNYDIHLIPGTYVGWLDRINWIKQYDDANTYAMLLIMAVQPLLLVSLIEKRVIHRAFYIFALLTLVYGVFLTESRGALIGLLAGASVLMLNKYSKKTGLIMALVIGLFVWSQVPDRMQEINTEDSSAASRVTFWTAGLNLFYDNLLVGVGYRQFAEHVGMDAHNTLVSAFTEFGIIGYVLWVITIYICAKLLLRARFLDKSNPEHLVVINQSYAILASSVSMLTACFFISAFYDLFIIWMGLCVAWYGVASKMGVEFGPVFTGRDFFKVLILSAGLVFLVRVAVSVA